MFIGRVKGNVVASQKISVVVGRKLLLVEAHTVEPGPPAQLKATGRMLVVVDTVGAGEGEYVLVTQGSSARLTDMTADLPIDAVIVGIVDTLTVGGKTIYREQDQAGR